MWLMPSIRPHLVERTFSLAPPTMPGLVVIEAPSLDQYKDVSLPAGWSLYPVDDCPYVRDKLNRVFEQFPDEPFYAMISDDMVAETPGWDVMLAERSGSKRIAGSSQVHFPDHLGAGAIGGDLVRACGWLSCPALKHFYSDVVLELIGATFNCATVYRDIRIAHHHFAAGLAKRDESYERRGSSAQDRSAFDVWKVKEWPALRERLAPLYSC